MNHKRPNILIFMTDQQQGATVLPEHPCHTPNLDRLAAEGITFTNILCPAPHCCPARASFMSGLYPSRHGVFNNVNTQTAIHHSLNPGVTLFSEELRDAGYHLAYSGKWHVSRDEGAEDRGWVNLAGKSRKGAGAVRDRRDPDVWQSEKEDLKANRPRRRGEVLRPGWGNRLLYGSVPAKGPNGYEETGDHRVVQRALAGLADLASGDDPWCLFIGVGGPHDAFIIPENFARMYDPDMATHPNVARSAGKEKVSRFPPLHVDGYDRLVARPLWNEREIQLESYCAYEPDLCLYENTRYKPRAKPAPSELDKEIPQRMIAEARKRGMEAHIQIAPFFPPGVRELWKGN